MLELLKDKANKTLTLNGGLTNATSGTHCLDLFFRAGAMRTAKPEEIADVVRCAFAEDPVRTMKTLFFVRDVRGGLGERRFFRTALQLLAAEEPDAVRRNIAQIPEFGRFDDLCVLLRTPCEDAAIAVIRAQLHADRTAMDKQERVSLLAKWLPSVNASAEATRRDGRYLAEKLGMSERTYRKCLSALRRYIDVLETRLCNSDYTFDYSAVPGGAMMKYTRTFLRNDCERYCEYLNAVENGKAAIHTGTLYPYEIVRRSWCPSSEEDRKALDLTWRSLPPYGESDENAIAVVDGSGSMYCGQVGNVRPIDAALSLGLYFAEHNKGAFANHFITFSENPKLVEIKGRDITEKVRYCERFNECANTDLEAVFELILETAVENHVPQDELPTKLFIISDMEFDGCIVGGNSQPLYDTMRRMYEYAGYQLPQVVFWNVHSFQNNIPVKSGTCGTALVSGFSPALFDCVMEGELEPLRIMERTILAERYAVIS